LLATYDNGIADALLRAEQPKAEVRSTTQAGAQNPLLYIVMPSFEPVARRINQAELATKMLDAAIELRRRKLAGTASLPAVDPWAKNGESLLLTPALDGGFTLRSIYEVRPGKPVEYKFAAPDAGIVRR